MEESMFERLQRARLKPLKRISNSELSMFKSCAWLYKLRRLGVRSRQIYIPFSVGSMIHVGIAFLYMKGVTRVNSEKFRGMMEILEKRWIRNIPVGSQPEYAQKLMRQWFVMRGIFHGLMYQKIIERDLDTFNVIQIESKLSAPLIEKTVWNGTPDVCLEYKNDKELTTMDHKSTSKMDDSYRKNLLTSVELEGDKFLLEQLHGRKISHGFYNVLQKHYLYQRKGEGNREYADRILDEYKERSFHFRFRKDFNDDSNAHWLRQQRYWIRDIQHKSIENYFPMNDRSCTGFYDCPMLDFCSNKSDAVFNLHYERIKKLKKKG